MKQTIRFKMLTEKNKINDNWITVFAFLIIIFLTFVINVII
jgi:hypothetical protein